MKRRAFLAGSFTAGMVTALPAWAPAMTLDERGQLDLSGYRVQDPTAGFFDVPARRAYLKTTKAPVLVNEIDELKFGVSCRDVLALPVLNQDIALPGFYRDNEAWREAVKPFAAFENALSDLAAASVAGDDGYAADCLLSLLAQWARQGALTKFVSPVDVLDAQAWFQIESTLFAAALALSVVRDDLAHRAADVAEVDSWLARAADTHFAFPGRAGGTCCNNHFYRRALYQTAIGIQIGNDRMFQTGLAAIMSALSDATPEGALPLEMLRGERAAHYQNFALMHLAILAELIERQGYPAYSLEYDGKTLQSLIDFNFNAIDDPSLVIPFAGERKQWRGYLEDNQYLAWMEPYFARTGDPRAEALLTPLRPVYNRSLGGHLTLFFFKPA